MVLRGWNTVIGIIIIASVFCTYRGTANPSLTEGHAGDQEAMHSQTWVNPHNPDMQQQIEPVKAKKPSIVKDICTQAINNNPLIGKHLDGKIITIASIKKHIIMGANSRELLGTGNDINTILISILLTLIPLYQDKMNTKLPLKFIVIEYLKLLEHDRSRINILFDTLDIIFAHSAVALFMIVELSNLLKLNSINFYALCRLTEFDLHTCKDHEFLSILLNYPSPMFTARILIERLTPEFLSLCPNREKLCIIRIVSSDTLTLESEDRDYIAGIVNNNLLYHPNTIN